MKYSSRVRNLHGSPTVAAAEAVRAALRSNQDIVRFDIGEPDFDTPAHIREAGIEAIRSGFTHYTSARGIPELGEALAHNLKGAGLDVTPANLTFYPGSKLALFSVLSLLVDPGDEALIQNPVWPTYRSIVEYLGGTPVEVRTWSDDDPGYFSVGDIVSRMTLKTRVVVINSPCNPTGGIVGERKLEELAKACDAKGIVLVLDRIYSALTFDGPPDRVPHVNIEGANFVVISGFSKEFAMTGWRLGYTVAAKGFTDMLVRIQENTSTCAASFVQKAGVAALTGERSWQRRMNDEYRSRRDTMVAEIAKIPGWSCATPPGAFYCFPKVGPGDSSALSDSLLRVAGVSSVAGAHFGTAGEGHLRLSYTTTRERIVEGVSRIRRFVESSESS